MLYQVLMVVYLLVALAIIGLVLIQQGKGAGMGASFGAGASASLFGSSGSGNFLTRTTAILATVFFIISLLLGRIGSNNEILGDDWNNLEVPAATQQVNDSQKAANSAGDVPN